MNEPEADAFMKNKGSYIISGLTHSFIRFCVALTILWISFRINHNPLKAIGLIRSLIKERSNIYEKKAIRSGLKFYWSVNLPGWPSRAFNYFIYNEFRRIHDPDCSILQTIIVGITNTCPLDCVHCYESDNLSDKNKLSISDLKLIMEKIHRQGIKHIQFSGGEPLSRFDDMIELMNYSAKTINFWINTSGFGLTMEKARKMRKYGMTGAIISLDDWDESRHNAFRNNNKSFYWVKEAVRNCNEAGIIVCLSLCAIKEFVTEENLVRYHLMAKKIGAAFIRIMEPRKVGRFSDKDILLSTEQIDIINKFMITRNNDLTWADYPIIQFPGNHQRGSGCYGAGNRYIYIDPKGDFHACPFCRKPLGNVLVESIDSGIAKARSIGCHAFKKSELKTII
jgi:MoaA/NifB/PqqE/SkfB family radical SAM enzyme